MGDDALRPLASEQKGLASRWQLVGGPTPTADAADWATRGLRRPFAGVCVTGWGPITQDQLWLAATLTAPATALSRTSAGAFWQIRPDRGRTVTVTRPGSRGRSTSGRLVVHYSRTLDGNVVVVDGLLVTAPERTLIDLWPLLPAWERSKMLREALRLGVTNPTQLLAVLHAHQGRRGTRALRDELLSRMRLPFDRCRSDAEAFGLVVLDDAGLEIPRVNECFAGEEADFCWPDRRDILEIDGPQWHRFKEEDARKTAIWTAAGFRVQRLGSQELFADPSSLLRLAAPAGP